MKSIIRPGLFSILFFLATFQVIAGDGPGQCNWLTDFDEAKSAAVISNRPILINFSGSDWCLPCMRLDRDLFSTERFVEYSEDNLVLLKLDFPARKKNQLSEFQLKHNETLAEIYNKRGAFPLVVITDAEGNVLGHMEHPLTSPKAYINSIESLISPQ